MSNPVFHELCHKLQASQVDFQELHHPAVFTSEEAAQVRGTSLASGAKALICKADSAFVMIVLPADLRLASKAIRKALSIRSLRFASQQEVEELTGLQPGAIPPFGSLFGLPTWCDRRLAEQPAINFNAGDHTISLSLPFADFQRVEQPRMGEFAEERS